MAAKRKRAGETDAVISQDRIVRVVDELDAERLSSLVGLSEVVPAEAWKALADTLQWLGHVKRRVPGRVPWSSSVAD